MGQNQQCLQCSSWNHTTFNCHMGIHNSIKICANCKRRGHWSEDCKNRKVVLINSKKPCNYCLKIHYQTVLNCPLRYEHLKKLSKEEHSSEKLMEKVGLPKDVMEVINPDINLGKWIHNLNLTQHYVDQILIDPTYSDIYKRVQQGPIHLVQVANRFLYLCRRNTWRMVIPEGFKMEGMSAIHYLINQAHNNCGHGGTEKTYKELSNKYIWQNIYYKTKEFVKSCENCQLTKGSTQLPMGLSTSLYVTTRPWEIIGMDFISFEHVIIPYSKLIPGYKDPVREKPYMGIFHKMLGITCGHSDYTFLVPCISHINAQ